VHGSNGFPDHHKMQMAITKGVWREDVDARCVAGSLANKANDIAAVDTDAEKLCVLQGYFGLCMLVGKPPCLLGTHMPHVDTPPFWQR